MKFALTCGAVLLSFALIGRAQTAQEWTLGLAQYGLVKTGCAGYPGDVEFLDDDRLVISAPAAFTCNKGNWGEPTDTRITEIDLQGHQLAAISRTDVAEFAAGPIGYVAVCTKDHVELLSRDLRPAVTVWESGRSGGCYQDRLSPSRTAMLIPGPENSDYRLYEGSLGDPIAKTTISKGQSIEAIADDGFLVCTHKKKQCELIGAQGVVRSFPVPQLWGASGSYVVGLVAPDRLLLASFDGTRLYAETPGGPTVAMGDVGKIKPPFIDSDDAQMSVAEPRRILYRVDGCLLGDFDDCYGVVFRRFAVFDSQTSRMLFRHSYPAGANLKISPNGKLVMEQNGAEVHFFRLP